MTTFLLKKHIHKIYDKVGIKSNRTKNITKHVVLSFIYKGGSIIANLLLVPLTINYLDTENYGVWLTLSSFIAWFSFFDIGLGNGLRNKFAEAKAKGDMLLARAYVSSAYFTIGLVCVVLVIVFIGINFFIDWTKVFNTDVTLQKDLSLLMPIVFGFFCLQLVTKLITTIYTADQYHSVQGKINFFTQAGSLLLIWFMTFTSKSSLLLFGLIFSAFPVLILIGMNFFAFSNRYKEFKPMFTLWKKKYLKDIFGLGVSFFIVQISGVILFATDNFIIAHLFTPSEVVPYNISFKYFSVSNMVFGIITTPFWSSITEAYAKGDYNWIKKTIGSFNKIAYLFVAMLLLMLFLAEFVYQHWIGDKVEVSFRLNLYIAVFFAITFLSTPYTLFLNGVGKVKVQSIQAVIVALLNIPLSFVFARNLNFGTSGIILATVLCMIPTLFLAPLQYKKIINNSANGIWNE